MFPDNHGSNFFCLDQLRHHTIYIDYALHMGMRYAEKCDFNESHRYFQVNTQIYPVGYFKFFLWVRA